MTNGATGSRRSRWAVAGLLACLVLAACNPTRNDITRQHAIENAQAVAQMRFGGEVRDAREGLLSADDRAAFHLDAADQQERVWLVTLVGEIRDCPDDRSVAPELCPWEAATMMVYIEEDGSVIGWRTFTTLEPPPPSGAA